jgi:transcriptional regulator with XRE-family HTH domain
MPKPKTPTWKAYVLEARRQARMSQQALADAIGANKSTVWRWENEDRAPESVEVAEKVADATNTPRATARAAGGFAASDDEGTDPRLAGLDPDDPVVRHIMSLDVDEEMREMMLDRRRQILADRARQDIDEIEFWANRGDRRERGERGERGAA